MKKLKLYSAPEMEVRKSLIRTSILAGSTGGTTSGTPSSNPTGGIATGKDIPINARKNNNLIIEY